jgi:hypothetical protein
MQAGVGVVLVSWENEPRRFVNKIEAGSSAEQSNQVKLAAAHPHPPRPTPPSPRRGVQQVQVWDELRSVNGTPIAALRDDALVELVRGPPGTSVALGLARPAPDGTTVEQQVELRREPRPAHADMDR